MATDSLAVPRQQSLLADVARQERPWKRVRAVSKQVYAELRKGGYTKRSAVRVLTALAWYRNARQEWPTPAELAAFMFSRQRIARNDPRIVAPRVTEMLRGVVVRLKDGTTVRRGGGVLTLLPTRVCRETGMRAHPVAIREIGSSEREAA
jgi:hypothetical protein